MVIGGIANLLLVTPELEHIFVLEHRNILMTWHIHFCLTHSFDKVLDLLPNHYSNLFKHFKPLRLPRVHPLFTNLYRITAKISNTSSKSPGRKTTHSHPKQAPVVSPLWFAVICMRH